MEQNELNGTVISSSKHTKNYSCCDIVKGFSGCLGGLFIHLIISSLYQWGIINTYVTSYYKVSSDPEITLEDNAIVFPVMMVSIGLMMRPGLILAKKFGTLPILYICNVVCSGCVFFASYLKDFGSNCFLRKVLLLCME